MRTRSHNPFLPKWRPGQPIPWRTGPFATGKAARKKEMLEKDSFEPASHEFDARWRSKPPLQQTNRDKTGKKAQLAQYSIQNPAGRLSAQRGRFLFDNVAAWGSNLDMVPLAHGPVGCSTWTLTERLNLPGFIQGIESFTSIDACTNLQMNDQEDGGDSRLSKAISELQELFPLAHGITILNEDPIAILNAAPKKVAQAATMATGKLVISLSCESIRVHCPWELETAAGLKSAALQTKQSSINDYDVAISFERTAPGLVWIVSKLLSDIGLNPVHELTCSSMRDMARISKCKFVIGFTENLDKPQDFPPYANARLLENWFNIPILRASFLDPLSTEHSLRTIASRFGPEIQANAERVITTGRLKTERVLAHYRPRLENKLVLDLNSMPGERLEAYRLLGIKIGTAKGWVGKTGAQRRPRLVLDLAYPTDKAIDSLLAEAKPDLVLYSHRGGSEWHKRGQAVLPFTPFHNPEMDSYWGYDGFLMLAGALDRAMNAPWRNLVKPPWPRD